MKKNNQELEDLIQNNSLVCHKQTFSSTLYRYWLDGPIEDTGYYRELIQTLLTASEDDVVELMISSGGGYLSSAANIISAIRNTSAFVNGVILYECHSAASMIALACHSLHVTDHSSMMVHYVSGGCVGRFNDVITQAEHAKKSLLGMIEDYYEGFLTPEEISDVVEGRCGDLWFSSEDIVSRLEQRERYREEQALLLEEEAKPEPKRKTRKKKES